MAVSYDGRGRKFPIVIARGTDVAFQLTVTDAAGAPVNMTSATVAATIFTKAGATVVSFTSAVSGAGSNVVTLSLTDTQTAALTATGYQWSMLVTRGGDKRAWFAGGVTVVDSDNGGGPTSGNRPVTVDSELNVNVGGIGLVNSDADVAGYVNDPVSATTTALAAQYAPQAGAINIRIPLNIPTYDDLPSITHPDVVLFDRPWNGYRYWMAFTPYPDGLREAPSIAASNDGVTWEVPGGLTNPLVSQAQVAGINWFSDTDMVYDEDSDKLVLFFRGNRAVPNVERIFRSESSDGRTWTTAGATDLSQLATVINADTGHNSELLSPAVAIEDDGTWRMWTVDNAEDSTAFTVNVRSSADSGLTWGSPSAVTIPTGVVAWHLDVVRAGGKYHMLLNGNPTLREGSHLYYLTSADGVTWTGDVSRRSLPLSGFGFDSWRHYRSTFVPVPGDPLRFDIWVSGISTGYQSSDDHLTDPWLVGLFRNVSFDFSDLDSRYAPISPGPQTVVPYASTILPNTYATTMLAHQVANRAFGMAFDLTVPTTVRYAHFRFGTSSGQFQAAILSAVDGSNINFVRVADTGLIACPTGATRVDLGDTLLPPGRHWLAYWLDNTTATMPSVDAGGVLGSPNMLVAARLNSSASGIPASGAWSATDGGWITWTALTSR